MRRAARPQAPADLTYLALRRSVGIIALILPFAVALPWLISHHEFLSSISAGYYTGMRNFFVGSLCAVALFMVCTRGYDTEDMVAGILSGIFGICVAFIPTTPPPFASQCACENHRDLGSIHYVFAALLFLTLAYFCFFLFTMSAHGVELTQKKRRRNVVYYVCGTIILFSIAMIGLIKLGAINWRSASVPYGILFETTSLLSFGTAWLVKGGGVWILND